MVTEKTVTTSTVLDFRYYILRSLLLEIIDFTIQFSSTFMVYLDHVLQGQ